MLAWKLTIAKTFKPDNIAPKHTVGPSLILKIVLHYIISKKLESTLSIDLSKPKHNFKIFVQTQPSPSGPQRFVLVIQTLAGM